LKIEKYAITRPRIVRPEFIYITWSRMGLSTSAELLVLASLARPRPKTKIKTQKLSQAVSKQDSVG